MDQTKRVGAQSVEDLCAVMNSFKSMLESFQSLTASFMTNVEADVRVIRQQYQGVGTQLEMLRTSVNEYTKHFELRLTSIENRVGVLEEKFGQYMKAAREKEDTAEIKLED